MTAIAQSLLTGPLVTLSKAHLTPQEIAKWIAHQRTQLEAETFNSCTLTTTIRERSWAMIELKIDSSRQEGLAGRVGHEHFLQGLGGSLRLGQQGRFLDAPSIWRTLAHNLRKTTHVDSSGMDKLSESYVAFILEQSFHRVVRGFHRVVRIRWNRQPLERHEHKCDVSPRVRAGTAGGRSVPG
jgi:hypothetical protein